ncbi:hypothetical protein CK203_004741 [Vitis vinifera]|uniref:DUF4283 domain-containing protein n=1 Tax=Vitis vinifera TaxID=29760 RepID=A0A438KFE7_VITVI|nr:hypothetical protein CK203_004741 [Vitis vinifera]
MQALVVCWLELSLAAEIEMIEVGLSRVTPGRLEQLGRCLVGRWEKVETHPPELDYLKNWAGHAWLLKGKLDIAAMGSGLLLFEFELLSEAERVLARGKRKVLGGVYFWKNGTQRWGVFAMEPLLTSLGQSGGLPLHLWNREVFKLIGDGCGGFIVVDNKTDSMVELQWARLLVKMAGRIYLPQSRLWLGRGASLSSCGGKPHLGFLRGSVLEKDVQPKEQVGVQVEPPCGSFSKGAIRFPSKSTERGPGVEAIDGEDSLGTEVKGVAGMGFEPGLGEIKGVRAHSHAEVGEMEVKATKEASCVQVKEDAPLRAVLTDGSPWVTGTEGEKYIGNRTQANEDLQKREDLGSSWDESNLAKFIFWDSRVLELAGMEVGLFSISCRFKNCEDGFRWIFSGVYGLTMKRYRELFWEELGPSVGFGMIHGGPFTWSGGLNSQAMSRLDRFLVSEDWEGHFNRVVQCTLPRPVSDHFPILLDGGGVRRGLSPSEKLKALKAILKSWNKDVFGKVGVNKKLALEKVDFWDAQEKLCPLSMEELEARKEAKGDFEKWTLMKEDLLTDPRGWHPFMEGLDFNKIDVEEAARLEEVFSKEEVFSALSDLNGDKALGPDGAEDLKDFRPISLVGGLYKLLTKVLANRLKKVVGKVVSSARNAFVEGRQILDAAFIDNEAIDSLLKRNESGLKEAASGGSLSPYVFVIGIEALSRENLWRHVISRKFGEEERGWFTREVREGFGVGFWEEIRKEGAILQNRVVFFVGNGRSVKFWNDIWCGNFALCNSFPSLYAFASSKEARVVELWDPSGEEGVWSPSFSRPFNDWEVEEVERLLLSTGEGGSILFWKIECCGKRLRMGFSQLNLFIMI